MQEWHTKGGKFQDYRECGIILQKSRPQNRNFIEMTLRNFFYPPLKINLFENSHTVKLTIFVQLQKF